MPRQLAPARVQLGDRDTAGEALGVELPELRERHPILEYFHQA